MTAADLPLAAPVRLRASAGEIAARIAADHGLTLADIAGRGNRRSLSVARQAAMLACARAGFGSAHIGRVLRRDHTTVLFGIARAMAREDARADMGSQAA